MKVPYLLLLLLLPWSANGFPHEPGELDPFVDSFVFPVFTPDLWAFGHGTIDITPLLTHSHQLSVRLDFLTLCLPIGPEHPVPTETTLDLDRDVVHTPLVLLSGPGIYTSTTVLWYGELPVAGSFKPGEEYHGYGFGITVRSVRCCISLDNASSIWLLRFPPRPFYCCFMSGKCSLRISRAQCVIIPHISRRTSCLLSLGATLVHDCFLLGLLLLLSGDIGKLLVLVQF